MSTTSSSTGALGALVQAVAGALRAPAVTLVCFHHAGGGAGVYRPWRAALPDGIGLHAVSLPGHDDRTGEPAHTELDPLLDQLDRELAPVLERPHVLFGHSMGALLAWSLTRRRLDRGARAPLALVAAGYGAPHRTRTVLGADLDTLDDLDLARRLHAAGGLPAEFLARPEWLRLLLAPVRADLAVCASHRPAPPEPLPVPLHVFGGTTDPLVTPADLQAWSAHAGAGFDLTLLDGGHFLVQDPAAGLLPAVLAALPATPHGGHHA
jgi:surfactin synthase thioesterase subunit